MTLGNSQLDEVLNSDTDSVTEYVPRSTRPKAPSIATRRRSRMLYMEKYGLNQPDWHKGSQDDYLQNQDDDDDDSDSDSDNNDEDDAIIISNSNNNNKNKNNEIEYVNTKTLSPSSSILSSASLVSSPSSLSPSNSENDYEDIKNRYSEALDDDNSGNITPSSTFSTNTNTNATSDLPHRQQQQQQQQQQNAFFIADSNSFLPSESTTTTTTTSIRSKSISIKRPVSIRTFVQGDNRQRRPARFIKPTNQPNVESTIPPEFVHVQALVEEYNNKVYMEGYLYKRNDLNSNGKKSCNQQNWSLWYVELCGPVLTLWDAECDAEDTILPIYINITDASVKMEPTLTGETSNHVFSLNSAGANRYLLQPPNKPSLEAWVLAIRLSCFECARIQEIYTREFVTRPIYRSILFPPTTKKTILAASQGYVQVRFPGTTGWKQYWAVVTNKQVQKSFFSKKVIATRGQVMFYSNQKSKQPVMTLLDVSQAYTVYPESPKLIQRATLFKIEGSLYKTSSSPASTSTTQRLVSASASALIMTASSEELVRWLVGIYDTFHLYGKPGVLFNDPTNKEALNFGHGKTRGRLFLENTDVYAVSIEPTTTLMETKAHFNDILMKKMLYSSLSPSQQQQPLKRNTFTELNIHPETTTTNHHHHHHHHRQRHSSQKSRSNPLRNNTCEDDRLSSVSTHSRHSITDNHTRYSTTTTTSSSPSSSPSPQRQQLQLNHHILQQHNNEFQASPVSLDQSYSTHSEDMMMMSPRKAHSRTSFSSGSNNDSVLSKLEKRSSRRPNSVMALSSHWPMFGSSGSVGGGDEYPTSPSTSGGDTFSVSEQQHHHQLGKSLFHNSTDSFHQHHADHNIGLEDQRKSWVNPLIQIPEKLDPLDEKAMLERYFLEQKQQLIMMQQYMYQQYGPTVLSDPKFMIPSELPLHQEN